MSKHNTSFRAIALVTLLFIVLSILSTLPLALDPFGSFPGSDADNDMRFNLWVIFWGYHALLHQPLELHQANIFYPEENTFVYSDIELSHSLLMAPFIATTYHPEFIYNMLVLLSLVIGGVGYYLFIYRLLGLHSAAVIGSLLIQFNPARFHRLTQIQFFADHWMPWTLLALWKWLDGKKNESRWLWATLSALLFSLHALSGSHNAVFGTIVVGVFGLYFVFRNRLFRQPGFYLQFALVGTLVLLMLAPVFLPYISVGKAMEEQRIYSQEALRLGSARGIEFFSSGSHFSNWIEESTGWPRKFFNQVARGALWPGLVPLILLAIGLFLCKKTLAASGTGKFVFSLDIYSVAATLLLVFAVFVLPASSHSTNQFFFSPLFWSGVTALIIIGWRLFTASDQTHALTILYRNALHSPLLTGQPLLWFALLLFSIWASFGPDAFLYNVLSGIPGVNLIRVPRRFFLIGVISLGVLSAYAIVVLKKHIQSTRIYLAILSALVLFFAIETNIAPMRVFPVRSPHPVYEWLGEQEGSFTVLEYPIHPEAYGEAIRQVYGSIHHWKNLITGYSGYQSQENIELVQFIGRNFPDSSVLKKLAELDTRFVIVLKDRVPEERLAEIENCVAQGRLAPITSFGEMTVYELTSWTE